MAALFLYGKGSERVIKKRKVARLFNGMMIAVAILFFTNTARAVTAFQPTNFITEFECVTNEFTADVKFYQYVATFSDLSYGPL